MKNIQKSIIMIMILSLTATSAALAQHGNRGMRGMRSDSLMMHGNHMMKMNPDSANRNMMRNHMQQMRRMHDGMWSGAMSHSRRGFGMGPGSWGAPSRYEHDYGYGRSSHPGMLQNIPNLTDKQKKDIADLRQKQMDEMKKFREETQTKMSAMRESFRNKIKEQLTEEQKKYLDVNSPKQVN
jgi:hypothetical protein